MTNNTHPVTLFTGQWADLPFEEVARLAADWGYDGLEIAASGDHLDLERADTDDAYLRSRIDILDRYNLKVFAISNHLTGQAVCDDPIDFRHKAILRASTWGDGDQADAKWLDELRKGGMEVTEKIDRQPFIDAVKSLEPEFEKRFGKDLLAAIRSTP